MATPTYCIKTRGERRTTCIDCGGATASVTGHRDNRPLCDICLIQQEPRLGTLIATHSTMQALIDASRPSRPAANEVLGIVLENARDLNTFFQRSWATANDAEMRLATTYDLSAVEARVRSLAGEQAARQFEDTQWVKQRILEAEQRGVNVKGYLLIAALETSKSSIVDNDGLRDRAYAGTESAIYGT